MTNNLSSYLWTPDGMHHVGLRQVVPNGHTQAQVFSFTFRYKGREKRVEIVGEPGMARSEIEDMAAKAAENYMKELDMEEHKRLPTEDEKKQIGKALNDIRSHMIKRRESSTGKLYFDGVKGLY